MRQINFRAMNCEMSATLDAQGEEVDAALTQVPQWFEQWEQTFSRFRTDSELNRLNASNGKVFKASPDLWWLLHDAIQTARHTQGLVTPIVFDALIQAGYDCSFEKISRRSLNRRLCAAEPLRLERLDEVLLNSAEQTIVLPSNMRLDLGGFAKGWCADKTVQSLLHIAPVLVDAGGDIAVSGMMSDGAFWPVAIADPIQVGCDLSHALLGTYKGLATSGRDYRHWLVDGQRHHHIIDPRTGCCANHDLLCASVMASSAEKAEVASKMLMILGAEAGLAWLGAHNEHEYQAWLVLDDGTLMTHGLSSGYNKKGI